MCCPTYIHTARAPSRTGRGTDAALIAQSRDDPEVFGEIYDRYAADVRRYLSRRIGSTLADDLTGETFLPALSRSSPPTPTATNSAGRHVSIAP